METVKRPLFKIQYQGRDITKDLAPYLISVSYTDNTADKSDECSFVLDDTDANWRGAWYPAKGDQVKLSMGYENALVDCGTFFVDEFEFDGPPDTVSIRAMASGTNSAIRTKKSRAYENQTLRQIAQAIAADHGFTVEGQILNIRIARVTQNKQTDLAFLKLVSNEYGHIFSIRDKKLVFSSIYDLEKGRPVLTIKRDQLMRYRLTDKATKTYKKARVRYSNPKDGKLIEGAADAKDLLENFNPSTAEDILEVWTKAENKQQADEKAKAALHEANTRSMEGSIVFPGNPIFLAGNTFELHDMFNLGGKYLIRSSTHTIDRSQGYTTEGDIKRIGTIKQLTTIRGDVLFDVDSSTIRPAGETYIKSVVRMMNDQPTTVVEVGGHTDSTASDSYNMALSSRRANAVRDYMVSQGIAPVRLTAVGYGETQPVDTNATAAGRQKNRRVEFKVK